MPDPGLRVLARILVDDPGQRVDRLVADATGEGRRVVRRWIEAGMVRSRDLPLAAGDRPPPRSEVVVLAPQQARQESPGPRRLEVLFADRRRAVVSKPAGLHCERGRSPDCVADLLDQAFGDLSRVGERASESGLVHRLDRDTSGVLVVALCKQEYLRLRERFGRGEVGKQYVALASGRLERKRIVDAPLARRATRMVPAGRHESGLPAQTEIEPMEGGADWTLVLASMRTGAMHQIRAHLALEGHPLFGDSLYGGPPLAGARRSGQMLHALRLRIAGDLDVTAPPPADFLAALATLRAGDRRGLAGSGAPTSS